MTGMVYVACYRMFQVSLELHRKTLPQQNKTRQNKTTVTTKTNKKPTQNRKRGDLP